MRSWDRQGTFYIQGAAKLIQGDAQLSRVQHNSVGSSVAQQCGARLGTRSQNPMIPLLLESYRLFSERLLTLFLMKLSFQVWQFPTKMFFRGRRNRRNSCLVPVDFRLFHRTENSRNSVPNHSTEEKTTRNSVPWNKNRRKHLEFCSEPFRGRKNNSEFRSVEQITKLTLRILSEV